MSKSAEFLVYPCLNSITRWLLNLPEDESQNFQGHGINTDIHKYLMRVANRRTVPGNIKMIQNIFKYIWPNLYS